MKVDVYSYAMLVWHIFTRQLPNGGKDMVLTDVTKLLDEKTVSVLRVWTTALSVCLPVLIHVYLSYPSCLLPCSPVQLVSTCILRFFPLPLSAPLSSSLPLFLSPSVPPSLSSFFPSSLSLFFFPSLPSSPPSPYLCPSRDLKSLKM